MTSAGPAQMASYELAFPKRASPSAEAAAAGGVESLPAAFLARNVLWLCRLRWIVAAILLTFGLVGLFKGAIGRIGLNPPGNWPFLAAGVLMVGNIVFLTHAHFLRPARSQSGTMMSLWSQIIFDLAVLTVVVHFLGSTGTYIPFTYLFHIVLACIFFSRRQSLVVMVIAAVMFAACVIAERVGIIGVRNIFAGPTWQHGEALGSWPFWLHSLSAVGIWLVVWYLASGLSMMVQQRDSELVRTNRRLVAAQAERARHMLTTTHQLKSPFAAIHANSQLLMKGYCGVLPEKAQEIVERIAARCRRLAMEIQDMLQLANLSSSGQQPPEQAQLDLTALLHSCIEQVRPLADARGIVFDTDIQPAQMVGVEDHLKMAFLNLLTNAVAYSDNDGHIRVGCRSEGPSRNIVTVSDDGIGIPADKLPRIFEEHYRTREAVQHNRESSGLGLAIVRQVAELHHFLLRVASAPGIGTTFELVLCPPEQAPADSRKETYDGTLDDSR